MLVPSPTDEVKPNPVKFAIGSLLSPYGPSFQVFLLQPVFAKDNNPSAFKDAVNPKPERTALLSLT